MIVLDASAAVEYLLRTPRGSAVTQRMLLALDVICAPHLIDVEVTQALRRIERTRQAGNSRVEAALADFADLPITRYPHIPLLPLMWRARANLSAYDASYVALAEALDVPLLTCDAKLAAAPGHRAKVELFE